MSSRPAWLRRAWFVATLGVATLSGCSKPPPEPPPARPGRSSPGDGAGCWPVGGDADVLDYFRTLWAGLRVGSELRQAMENVPENAGPLNSIHLVHQSLQLMHELAPDYLRHFLSYADTLSCLERMSGADLLLAKGVPSRGESPKKAGKSRSG